MTTSWLDLMAEDSNLSMASMASIKSSYDAEFDNSRQGVNLMFKKNVKIISDDSQSRKRTFDEMKESMDCNQENKYLPPKAKQRTNVKGDWTKRKSESNKENVNVNENENENKNENIGFGRFLKWAKNTNDGDDDDKNHKNSNKNKGVLSVKLNDNENNLIICNPTINHRKRKQFRAKRRNKNIKPFEKNQQSLSDSQSIMTKIEEEQQENNKDVDVDIDVDIDIDEPQKEEKQEQEKEEEEEEDVNMKTKMNMNVDDDDNDKDDDDQEVEVKEEEKEEKEKEDVEDDQDREDEHDEDDDLKTPIQKFKETKKRRITPTLQRVVLNTDLILNKVPILKKKDLNDESQQIIKAPIFLNADQYETLNKNTVKDDNKNENENEKEKVKEIENEIVNESENEIECESSSKYMEENEDFDCDVWANKKTENKSENEPKSWAQTLFAEKVKENKIIKDKEEALLVEKRKRERLHEMKINSILPPQPQSQHQPQHQAESVMFSRESSVSITTESSTTATITTTVTTTTTTTTSTPVCKPSADATEWRQKQISYGKNTVGYKHFIEKYPNKDLRFRLNNNLIATPDPKEKIGKKRWVGKYQKWRKFLHKFDDIE